VWKVGVPSFEVPKQQGAVAIKHVTAGPEIARCASADVGFPDARDSWPKESFATNVWRFAITRQHANASGVSVRNI